MKKKLLFIFLFPLAIAQAQTVCSPATGSVDLDINNVRAKLLGGGDMWWDQGLGTANYEVPAGSGHNTMYTGSIWLAGLDADNTIHAAAQTYRQTGNDFWPGPVNGTGTTDATNCLLYDRLWKVNKSEIIAHIANPASPPLSISGWPAKGNDLGGGNIITTDMAPFIDVNGNGLYEPTLGDYPKINGDQAIWWVINDVGNVHSETGASALGVEVQVMAYAFATNDVLNNTTFYNYNIKNKSATTYHDFYIGFWADCDLGGYTDDYIGCDSSRNAAIFYNADAFDTQYDTRIPVTSIVGINTPLENNIPVSMKYSGYINNNPNDNGNPSTAAHYYNYLTGKWKDNSPWGFNYAFPGSPCVSSETSMIHPTLLTPGDLRSIQSFGPMSFAPGDCKNITTAVLTTFNTIYPTPCFDNIRTSIDSVKALYQSLAVNNLSCQNTTSLYKQFNPASVSLYPNPANISVELNISNAPKGSYKVYALDGSLALSGFLNGSNTKLDISTINKGMYFVSILNQTGQVLAVKKLVKE